MESNPKSLLEAALSLPESDRAILANALLESLNPESDSPWGRAWKEEIEARIAALDSGQVQTRTWESVRETLWARLSEPRSD